MASSGQLPLKPLRRPHTLAQALLPPPALERWELSRGEGPLRVVWPLLRSLRCLVPGQPGRRWQGQLPGAGHTFLFSQSFLLYLEVPPALLAGFLFR